MDSEVGGRTLLHGDIAWRLFVATPAASLVPALVAGARVWASGANEAHRSSAFTSMRGWDNGIHIAWRSRPRWWRGAFVLIASLMLAACLPKEPERDPNGTFGSSVTAMDHDPSDTFVPNVHVNGTWLGSAGTGGSIVGGGGISLPHRWRPGLTATVTWQRCVRLDPKHPISDDEACHWVEKVVPINQYDKVGRTWLHILGGDRVLIIPSMLGPGHPDYPGPDLPTKDFFRSTGKEQAQ